ncbi:hypothetical protein Hamer_G021344 [Homarus americanus]|uniref:Uncharacterized protein n=1 Tax=Homarus americanus TaxID=6706 RepID=A0A8J5K3G6_HOMAM|nr:hypothetical protein Hamer_G021344 [Homarus americanus]
MKLVTLVVGVCVLILFLLLRQVSLVLALLLALSAVLTSVNADPVADPEPFFGKFKKHGKKGHGLTINTTDDFTTTRLSLFLTLCHN